MSVTEFAGTDGATRANFNAKIQQVNTHIADAVAHMTKDQKDQLAAAVQSATVNGAAVPKSGTALQFPAYPTNLPANGGHAASADTAGTATYAGYSTHTVALADNGVRGNFISSASPSGGNDGDTWDQV